MTRFRSVLILGLMTLAGSGYLAAQEREVRSEQYPGKNPHLNNKESIRGGMSLYRRLCGECHGLDATGYRGPNLIAYMADATDEALFQTIRKGVPGSEMPASNRPDVELLQIMAYLRNMNAVAPADNIPAGNIANGGQLFAKQCANCHRVAGKGGRIGPDLSRIGSARTREALVREIRTPHEWIPPAYETVTVVTKDGQKIRGIKKNEDAFSIQVMDMRERIQGYLKSDVEVLYDKNSLMPAFEASATSRTTCDRRCSMISACCLHFVRSPPTSLSERDFALPCMRRRHCHRSLQKPSSHCIVHYRRRSRMLRVTRTRALSTFESHWSTERWKCVWQMTALDSPEHVVMSMIVGEWDSRACGNAYTRSAGRFFLFHQQQQLLAPRCA